MVALNEQQAKIQADIIAHFKTISPLDCVLSENKTILLMQFRTITRGWFFNSNKSAFTVYFQKGLDTSTNHFVLSSIGVVVHDKINYVTHDAHIMEIIRNNYNHMAVGVKDHVPTGAYS